MEYRQYSSGVQYQTAQAPCQVHRHSLIRMAHSPLNNCVWSAHPRVVLLPRAMGLWLTQPMGQGWAGLFDSLGCSSRVLGSTAAPPAPHFWAKPTFLWGNRKFCCEQPIAMPEYAGDGNAGSYAGALASQDPTAESPDFSRTWKHSRMLLLPLQAGQEPGATAGPTPPLGTVSCSAKQETPLNCRCLKLSRNQFPLVRK